MWFEIRKCHHKPKRTPTRPSPTLVNPPLCKLGIVAPVHAADLLELEWLAGSVVAPHSPCVVGRYFGGVRGPPRDVQHVVLVFSRVSSKTMTLDPQTNT